MTRRSRNDNSSTTGNSFNHADADTMILVVYIRKLFILPYLAASGAVGIQLEQGWALISCYMLILTWLAPRRSLTSLPARAQIPTPSMDAKLCCSNRQTQPSGPRFLPHALRPIVARNAVSRTTQPTLSCGVLVGSWVASFATFWG